MHTNKIIVIFFFFISALTFSQYNFQLNKGDLKEIIVKSLSIEEIKKDSIVIRMNAVTSSFPISPKVLETPDINIKILRDKAIYSNLIKDYIDFSLIDISSNLAYIKYINRDKAMAIHLIFHKKITSGWTLVDKFVWKEISFKFDDFLYDSIRKKLANNK
ncbi:hypothetical protein [Aquimarina sp. 2201CG14-23]|uniref:hypothetical protein n=1 Tax=Aquimarina mycalae TaxID=3040073 RepID=UPI002477D390|nr:hypothetical protein [Aquimarina sp. 2201CG14-23]MDH7444939.1 hypothetical protein [Aquimarina sp. 2201CG14-23]